MEPDFTAAVRALFNRVVNKCRDKQSCQEGRPPFSFQSPEDGSLLGAILLGGGREASGCQWALG